MQCTQQRTNDAAYAVVGAYVRNARGTKDPGSVLLLSTCRMQ
jgi:hypothetical protein